MRHLMLLTAALTLLAAGSTRAESPKTSEPSIYPLETCLVSGERLGSHGEPVAKTIDGREMRVCCAPCFEPLEADSEQFLSELDEQIRKTQSALYPTQICVVSGNKLPDEPQEHILGHRLFWLCSPECVESLTSSPDRYVRSLDAAVAAVQQADYPADTCPVSGMALDSMGGPYDYTYAGRLIRFCCAGCIPSFEKNPAEGVAAIYGDAAEPAAESAAGK